MRTMKSLQVFICALVSLWSVDAGLLRGRKPQDFYGYLSSLSSPSSSHSSSHSSSFWSSHSSSSSSSFLSSLESSGGICLNGGSSVPSLTSGEHMFCLCADGFEGKRCETAKSAADCYEGVGLYYRGTVSVSQSGRRCQEWDSDTRNRYLTSDVNAGRHNFCRNLLYKRRPWCHVWKKNQLTWEYCDIPRCRVSSAPALPSSAPTEQVPGEVTGVREEDQAAESTCGLRTQRRQMKIVGGTVSTVESHPWVAAVFMRSKSKERAFTCGGSLISACWVLTAAHCFPDGSHNKPRRFSVSLGKNALNDTNPAVEQTFKVEQIIIHQDFDNSDGNYNNDIALIQLKAKNGKCAVESDSVKTICLPPPLKNLPPGVTCEIAGYGKEKFGLWYRSQFLQEAHVSLIADDVCKREDYYGSKITDNMFCAGLPDWSQDACEGDSGGPLACHVVDRLFLFGVISWGYECAREFRPGVYTRVTNYNKWIEEKTGLSSITEGSMFPQK